MPLLIMPIISAKSALFAFGVRELILIHFGQLLKYGQWDFLFKIFQQFSAQVLSITVI
jgi:hypothetical protein